MDKKAIFVICLIAIIGVIAFTVVNLREFGPNFEYGIIISVLGIIGIIYAGSLYLERQRKKEMELFAKRIGFSYVENLEAYNYPSAIPIFDKGHSKKIKNFIEGNREGKNWKIFDYFYTESYGKNAHTYAQTIIIPELKSRIPEFTMCPENILHKIGNLLGYKDIDFDNYPEFSNKYLLKGKMEAEVRQIFDPEIIRKIEKIEKKICLESDGKSLAFYLHSQRMIPSEIEKYIGSIAEVATIFDSKRSQY